LCHLKLVQMRIEVKKYFNGQSLKNLLLGLVLTALTFVFLFSVLEVVLRIIKIQSDNFIMQDPVLGWIHLSNKEGYSRDEEFSVKVRLNKDGFIGRDYEYLKPEKTIRILVIGDSITEAFQVEEGESYSKLLGQKLKDSFSSINFEVLNMGIAGYGTEREYYIFRDRGLKFDPDIVVLGFFVGNDFSDNMSENINPEAAFSKYTSFKNKIKLFIRNHSTTWRFILRQKSRNSLLAYFKNRGNTNLENNGEIDASPLDTKSQLDRSIFLIRKFKKLADEHDVDLVVALLPSASPTYSDRENTLVRLSDDLVDLLAKENIDHVDLLQNFADWAKINSNKTAHFLLDGHPNFDGQSIIADGISSYLKITLGKKIKNGDF